MIFDLRLGTGGDVGVGRRECLDSSRAFEATFVMRLRRKKKSKKAKEEEAKKLAEAAGGEASNVASGDVASGEGGSGVASSNNPDTVVELEEPELSGVYTKISLIINMQCFVAS